MTVKSSPRDSAVRRIVDVVVASTALLVLAPLFALIAAAVKLDSVGPVFFRQVRIGRYGIPFSLVKFRTMVADAARRGPRISGNRDPRVTRVGRLLRKTRIDELPQLWNVVRGEMTLVGPRPEIPEMVRHYTAEERQLLQVRPGLIGPGQLHFAARQAAELDEVGDAEAHYIEHQLHPKLRLDLDYLRRRGLLRDLALVLEVVRVLAWPARRH